VEAKQGVEEGACQHIILLCVQAEMKAWCVIANKRSCVTMFESNNQSCSIS